MMKFAIPALGIYLCNPLLSNIDNAFVGRTVGTSGLAALSPGTLCTDQLLYLFSFLARATTGLVSRAYAITDEDRQDQGNTEAARRAASAPLTVSIICGMILSVFYALFTPNLLAAFNVRPSLRPAAASYIYWRGSVAWASLAQKNMLSVLMATRDAVTPLKIVVLASLFNVLGDAALCVWPAQWGCAGAAAATAGATLLSSAIMLRALRTKGLLPEIRVPRRAEMSELLEFTGPLLAITLTRLAGFIVMQRSAAKLGVAPLAAYQLCVNLLLFFLLFGEPLSQLSQTKLPSLIDSNDTDAVSGTLRSILSIAAFTSLSVGAVAFFAVEWGTRLFSTDTSVLALVQRAAPSLFCAIATSIFTVAVDGAMLASRDFGFMLSCGLGTFMAQIYLLHNHCTSIGFVFGTFTMRLGVYAVAALVRSIGMGRGNLGSVLHKRIPTS
jgi:Na+-driven multidrug efflux pump